MHYTSLVEGRLFALRWIEPTAEAARASTSEFERCARRVGAPLMFAAIVGPRSPMPNGEARRVMREEIGRAERFVHSSRMVVLGDGFRQSLIRGVLVNIALLGPGSKRPAVDGSAESFASVVEAELGIPAARLLPRLVEKGLVMPEELAT